MTELWKRYAKGKKEARYKRPHALWFYFCDMSRIGKSMETESGPGIVQGLGGGEDGKWPVKNDWVSFWEDEKLLEGDMGDGYTALGIWQKWTGLLERANLMISGFRLS